MACGESRGSNILLCLGLLVVASSFCHCRGLTKLKALDKLKGNSTLRHGEAKGIDLCHGRLLIGQNSLQDDKLKGTNATKNILNVDADYQEDMGWGEPKQLRVQGDGLSRPNSMSDNEAVVRILKMDPKVECTVDSMKLQVQDAASTPGSLLFVDRGSRLSPLPLSNLPSSCGYAITSTRTDLVVVAPYDGCFVTREEDSYVLPLRWCGLPVRMSCPLMKQASPNTPMVACHAQGMVVKTGWTVSVAKITVNLNGNWEPLMKASPRCRFSVVVHPEGVVISVHYAPCLEEKDGMYTFELAGEGETKISCPSLSPGQTGDNEKTPSKGVYYHYPAKPDTRPTPTVKPSQQTAPPKKLPVTPAKQMSQQIVPSKPDPDDKKPLKPEAPQGQVQKPFYHFYPHPDHVQQPFYHFYPHPEHEKPTAPPKPLQPKDPQLQVQQPFYHFYPHPDHIKPTAPPKPPQPKDPQLQVQQPFYPHPEPEKPTFPPKPPQPQEPQGQVQQPFYPHPEHEKPTVPPKPPQPKDPQLQVQQPFYYFYPHPDHIKPTAPPKPPQPENPQGQVQQPFYPHPEHEKPTAPTKPLRPKDPQVQVQQPFYPHPEHEKPTAPPKPPQPKDPQLQVQQPFYHFYPHPDHIKPTFPPKPPQPQEPQGQVQQPFYHFYPHPDHIKPTAPPKPPQPEDPQGQVQQPFYPHPEHEKPTAPPKPPQPKDPQLQVQQPFYYFYPHPDHEKPTAPPKPPQPENPQVQVQQPFYPHPEHEKPTAPPKPPQPKDPQLQVQQPFYYFYPHPDHEKPTAPPKPPQPENPQGQVQQPFYPHPEHEKPTAPPKPPQPKDPQLQVQQPFYYFYPHPDHEKPTAPPKPPQPENPQGQVQQPFYPHPEHEKPTAPPKPPQPKDPQLQVQQPFYYFYPHPDHEKPTAPPKPPQPENPQGQVQQPFYPHPEHEKPTAPPKPPQPENPQVQVQQPFYYFYPHPDHEKPTAPPKPPQPENPQGQVQQPFYPHPEHEKPTAPPKPPQPENPQVQVQQPFYPHPEHEKPTAPPKPPQPKDPQLQVQQPFYYFYPHPDHEKPTAPPKPPQPENPQGQVQQPFYPHPEHEKPTAPPKPPQPKDPQLQVQQPFYYFYPHPDHVKPTAPPKPLQPEDPQGQVQQHFYPQPEPAKPTAAPRPLQPEAPQGQVQQPFYPFFFYPQPEQNGQVHKRPHPQPSKIPGAGTEGPTEKPVQSEKPPAVKPPKEQMHHPFNQYFYTQQRKHPQPVTLPPATSMQQVQQVITHTSDQNTPDSAIPQPDKGVPQITQLSSQQPVHCPQFCTSGFLNCCPQIAFHQHLHQIIPAQLGSKDAPLLYPGLPLPPSLAYYGFGNDLSSALLPQKPTEATTMQSTTTSTSAPILSQSLQSGNEKRPHLQPPDGNPATLLGSFGKFTNPQQLIHPYMNPNSLYPHLPYLPQNEALQNLPQSQSAAHNPHAPSNPLLQYRPHNAHPSKQQNSQLSAGDMNIPPGPHFIPYIGQYSQQQHIANQHQQSSESKGPMHPRAQSELNSPLVPYYMLQDAQSQIYDNPTAPNASQPQPFVSGSKKPTKHEQTVQSYSEPKSFVLLQHGPPGREPNSFNGSPLPFRDLDRDAEFMAQNLARHDRSNPQHPQNLNPSQEKLQHPKQLGKGIFSPLPDVNYMQRPDDKSGSPFISLDGPHLMSLPQDPSVSDLNPKFKDFWRFMTPLGSGQPHLSVNAFQQKRAAADHQAKGLNKPTHSEKNGNQKHK